MVVVVVAIAQQERGRCSGECTEAVKLRRAEYHANTVLPEKSRYWYTVGVAEGGRACYLSWYCGTGGWRCDHRGGEKTPGPRTPWSLVGGACAVLHIYGVARVLHIIHADARASHYGVAPVAASCVRPGLFTILLAGSRFYSIQDQPARQLPGEKERSALKIIALSDTR